MSIPNIAPLRAHPEGEAVKSAAQVQGIARLSTADVRADPFVRDRPAGAISIRNIILESTALVASANKKRRVWACDLASAMNWKWNGMPVTLALRAAGRTKVVDIPNV